jgi:DNA-binding CsgD family transcriptional regulator/PAS domain-containing protein
MLRPSRAEHAVNAIYEAALDPAGWALALSAVTQQIGADTGVAVSIDLADRRVSFGALHNVDPACLGDYARHYASVDIWNDALLRLPARRPYFSHALVDEWTFTRSEFYNDFLRFQGMFHAVGGFVMRSGSQVFLCGAQRDRHRSHFEPSAGRRFSRLFPHLERAARLYGGLTAAGGLAEGLATALERMPQAALLVDGAGRIIWSNRLGEEQLRRADGIRLRDGRIEAAGSPSLTQELRRLIAGAASLIGDSTFTNGGSPASPTGSAVPGCADGLQPMASTNGNGSAMILVPKRRNNRRNQPSRRKTALRQGMAAPQIIRPPQEVALEDIGGLLLFPRAWPLRPLMVTVTPLAPRRQSGNITPGPPQPAALLLIHDPDRAVAMPAERLARVYGLTPAEAKLAAALAGGSSLGAYADNARITIGTARWYLKQVLAKTGAHRQSELVRQVVMTAGTGPGGEGPRPVA